MGALQISWMRCPVHAATSMGRPAKLCYSKASTTYARTTCVALEQREASIWKIMALERWIKKVLPCSCFTECFSERSEATYLEGSAVRDCWRSCRKYRHPLPPCRQDYRVKTTSRSSSRCHQWRCTASCLRHRP